MSLYGKIKQNLIVNQDFPELKTIFCQQCGQYPRTLMECRVCNGNLCEKCYTINNVALNGCIFCNNPESIIFEKKVNNSPLITQLKTYCENVHLGCQIQIMLSNPVNWDLHIESCEYSPYICQYLCNTPNLNRKTQEYH